jgi:hypothetical protein
MSKLVDKTLEKRLAYEQFGAFLIPPADLSDIEFVS